MRAAAAGAVALLLAGTAQAQDWRPVDPENTLLIDTTKGRIIVEMRPELAPKAVERIKRLTRERVYDGLQFHRVIDGFVAQTGNPNNKDGGVSRHPDLEPEFTSEMSDVAVIKAATRSDGIEGFVGSTPVAGAKARTGGGGLRIWGAYCTGVVGMGRQADESTANSEIFVMRAPARRLDRDYTVWGRVLVGQGIVDALAVGEPPRQPDLMRQVRLLAELPAADRPRLEVETGPALSRRIAEARSARGPDFSVCDVTPATRLRP